MKNRRKLQARLGEAEEAIESLNQKNVALEKIKMRLSGELDDMHVEVERAHLLANQMEKRGKNFDKVVSEWKAKVDDLAAELDASQKECRNYSTELFRLKAGYDESQEHLEAVRRENKNLADEIKDLMDQIGEGGRNVHEIDKQRKRLEVEKEELQAALEEAESALEQEENKVIFNYFSSSFFKNSNCNCFRYPPPGASCSAGTFSGAPGDRPPHPGEGGGIREHAQEPPARHRLDAGQFGSRGQG